ncbi:N-acetylmuramoyl-L-alanine amidase [Sulfitobacter sp. HNIBRBA2951]|uniref:N-acetylmuramoyl-L-alanine amidase n=1 Tax=Sulfitobacter aquimarinus TaxID=3158557 RepID=UPI0032DF6DAB
MAVMHPSPNCGPRRDGLLPTLVLIHYTAMGSAQAALERLCDPTAEVSAHYLIGAGGDVTQMVEETARAWHAGAGEWCGQDDINSRSIGIELDNRGTHPFSEPQMAALEQLLRGIMARWDIAPSGVIGHSDIAPARKIDPGPRFDWRRLERQGLAASAVPREVGAGDEAAFIAAARSAGFTADVDVATLLAATRLRHAPWRTGPLQRDDFTL